MTKTGYTKQQQAELKRLVYDCSIARIPTVEIKSLAHEKLDIEVTENWIGRIKRRLRQDSEKEYKHLLTDNFAFKYQIMRTIHELEEIQRRKWLLCNKEHLTNEDLIRLKCLSELEESTTLIADVYDALPGIDSFTSPYEEQQNDNNGFIVHKEAKVYDSRARASNAGLATFTRYKDAFGQEREVAEHPDYKGSGPIHPDYKGRYPWDEGYEGNAKF